MLDCAVAVVKYVLFSGQAGNMLFKFGELTAKVSLIEVTQNNYCGVCKFPLYYLFGLQALIALHSHKPEGGYTPDQNEGGEFSWWVKTFAIDKKRIPIRERSV